MSDKKPIDREYLISSLKEFDKEILSKKYNNIIYPINFKGYLNATYDGKQEIDIEFPNLELTNNSAGTPVGEIISYMGITAPDNYLICDGTEYNIIDYPYLVQHFIDNFGSVNYFGGDGEATFAVPNLQGEFLRGAGTNAHKYSGNGANVGVHQNPTYLPMFAVYEGGDIGAYHNTGELQYIMNSDSGIPFSNEKLGSRFTKTSTFISTNNNVVNATRPTNTSVLWCIKCKPTYFVDMGHNYCYKERRVGTWVDGKPLYEKTVDLGCFENENISVEFTDEECENVFIISGYAKTKDSNVWNPVSINHGQSSWLVWVANNTVRINVEENMYIRQAIVTLRYTKATD